MLLLAVLSTVDDTTIDPFTRSTKLRTALWESGVAPETDFGVFRLRLICSCRARISILDLTVLERTLCRRHRERLVAGLATLKLILACVPSTGVPVSGTRVPGPGTA